MRFLARQSDPAVLCSQAIKLACTHNDVCKASASCTPPPRVPVVSKQTLRRHTESCVDQHHHLHSRACLSAKAKLCESRWRPAARSELVVQTWWVSDGSWPLCSAHHICFVTLQWRLCLCDGCCWLLGSKPFPPLPHNTLSLPYTRATGLLCTNRIAALLIFSGMTVRFQPRMETTRSAVECR